ncbi:MAG TPA: class I SAM-dependent methyltransferase [Gaiellaceae bacterium]|nr:class I SAM-dependent methyltransferase [Gaiellaceae bacterium]
MTTWDKYSPKADSWTENAYADARAYLARRADLVRVLGPVLEPGDTVLDLACGDGGLADFLPQQRYVGVDASPEMVDAGLRHGREVVQADLNEYVPARPVQATTLFRALYYAVDRRALFAHVGAYTERKLVFDVNPRQYRLRDVRADLAAAGFDRVAVRPFFVPQTRAMARLPALVLRAAERSGPPARLVLRFRFTLICAAWRKRGS